MSISHIRGGQMKDRSIEGNKIAQKTLKNEHIADDATISESKLNIDWETHNTNILKSKKIVNYVQINATDVSGLSVVNVTSKGIIASNELYTTSNSPNEGVIIDAPGNKVVIRDSITGNAILANIGNSNDTIYEVYGRITYNLNEFDLTFYYTDKNETETRYTMSTGQKIDWQYLKRFNLNTIDETFTTNKKFVNDIVEINTSLNINQLAKDIYGTTYTLDRDGNANLTTSLSKQISDEAKARGDGDTALTTDLSTVNTANKGANMIGIQDSANKITATTVEGALAEIVSNLNSEITNRGNADTIIKNDLASNNNGKGASLIGIEDSANKITATTVEGALIELATNLASVSSNTGNVDSGIRNDLASTDSSTKGANMIGIQDSANKITATTVEGALAEIATNLAAEITNRSNITINLASNTNGKGASLIGIEDPNDKIVATTVEGALVEIAINLASEVANRGNADTTIRNDLISNSNGKGASLIGIEDSANKITATTVEDALAELADNVNTAIGQQTKFETIDKELVETFFYDEITYSKINDSVTGVDYYVTTIPHIDKDGNIIKLEHGFQNDAFNSGQGESARSYSARNITSFCANASIWHTDTKYAIGVQIKDQTIFQDQDGTSCYSLGIKNDNTLVAYPPSTTAQQMLDDGCMDVVTGFYPLIQNSSPVDSSVYISTGNTTTIHPRNTIGQMPNKDIVFITSDTTLDTEGFTYDDLIRIYQSLGVTFAYCLDGGGSTQSVVRGMMINKPIDNNGKTERLVTDFLYVKKPAINPQRQQTLSEDIGIVNKHVFDVESDLYHKTDMNKGYIALKGDSNFAYQGIEAWQGTTKYGKLSLKTDTLSYHDYTNNRDLFSVDSTGHITTILGTLGAFLKTPLTITDCNTLTETGFYWILATGANIPGNSSSWLIFHVQVSSTAALQFAVPFHDSIGNFMSRRTNTGNDDWYPWRQI